MSLMTGRDTRETAQAIAERFNVGQNDARRLVRTESAFFITKWNYSAMKKQT